MHSLFKQFFMLGLLIGLFYVFFWNKTADRPLANFNCQEVQIAEKTFILERSLTSEEKDRGLSGRDFLDENSGMIFEFEQSGVYGFWMKDMLIPIDIIFIKDDTITDVYNSVIPESFPEVFYPNTNINYVIELSSGVSEKLNIKSGEKIKILSLKEC